MRNEDYPGAAALLCIQLHLDEPAPDAAEKAQTG